MFVILETQISFQNRPQNFWSWISSKSPLQLDLWLFQNRISKHDPVNYKGGQKAWLLAALQTDVTLFGRHNIYPKNRIFPNFLDEKSVQKNFCPILFFSKSSLFSELAKTALIYSIVRHPFERYVCYKCKFCCFFISFFV